MDQTYTVFRGWTRVGTGSLEEVLRQVKGQLDGAPADEMVLIFEDQTGRQVDFDMRGLIGEVLERAGVPVARTGPGRPKLGVTSREVSLLPRHWDWLAMQSQGASASLRRLVDEARKRDSGESDLRAAIDAKGRVMGAIGGNLPGFEEAYRALYARDRVRLEQLVSDWPVDLRAYVLAEA